MKKLSDLTVVLIIAFIVACCAALVVSDYHHDTIAMAGAHIMIDE
jgi:hypothetical protein